MLAQIPFDEWNENLHKTLHGECSGLGEVRFESGNVQFRPLGFRSGEFEYTILFCALEKEGKFDPKTACKMALDRKAEVLECEERTNDLWLALE